MKVKDLEKRFKTFNSDAIIRVGTIPKIESHEYNDDIEIFYSSEDMTRENADFVYILERINE